MKEITHPSEDIRFRYGKVHELKTWPTYFNSIRNGFKTFEVRKNDRDFKSGDTLLFQEYNPNDEYFTGACITKIVSYILKGGQFGIEEGYCVMGLSNL